MLYGLLSGLATAYFHLRFRRSQPRQRGRVQLPGLQGPVEVIGDPWGVPHIYATSPQDLFLAQGYVHARDRLWQMELHRRTALGRLAEMAGPVALPLDRLTRRLGFRRAAEQELADLDGETRARLEAYCEGINAFIQEGPQPPEFSLLRMKPELWSVEHILALGKFFLWSLSFNWDTELVRSWLLEKVGPEGMAYLDPPYLPPAPLSVPPGISYRGPGHLTSEVYQELQRMVLAAGPRASNAWAVDGQKSTTGKPLLACDPHLPLTLPSVWYVLHLEAGDLRAIGPSIPGLPGIAMGHNGRIAWGMTASMVDTQDLYWERLHPERPWQYQFQGGWREGRIVREEIRVKGREEPVIEEVLITHHGPDVGPALGVERKGMALTLKSTALALPPPLWCNLRLLSTAGWEEFRQVLERWTAPALNFVYADVAGNIGYQLAGHIPLRSQGYGLVPALGWTGEQEWVGYIPFPELPYSYNPPAHYVATANNKVTDDGYPYFLGFDWADGFRMQRIVQLLEGKERLSPEDFQQMQSDCYSLVAERLLPALLPWLPREGEAERLVGYLQGWDYRLSPESVPAALYQVFVERLYRNIFAPVLDELLPYYLGEGLHPLAPGTSYGFRGASQLLRVVREGGPPWLGGQAWRDTIARSFREAIAYLKGRLGSDPSRWQWGRLHAVVLEHALGQVKPLARLFNRGPFPIGGDMNTLLATAFALDEKGGETRVAPSYRQVIDLGDFSHSLFVYPGGQSGHPLSPHYDDLIERWRQGRYCPLLFQREEVLHHARQVLLLEPL